MPVLTVEHVTTYRYRRVVGFGEHRMLFRPRDSADQRLLSWELRIAPRPALLRSVPDAFGNVSTVARFAGRARELRFENRLVVDHAATRPDAAQLAWYARTWPFSYDPDDAADLARVRERHHADPDHAVDTWARQFLRGGGATGTLDLLGDMTREIRRGFTYSARHEEGVQEPARTLALRNGTCRDFAVLMMEAARALGFAARFVSGYVYSAGSDDGAAPGGPNGGVNLGGGSTHAWVEVFLPGLGWTEFDPTNGIVGTSDLIRVASVRDWHQAVPLAGTWTGFPADSLGMTVTVKVGMRAGQVDRNAESGRSAPAFGDGTVAAGPAEIVRLPVRGGAGDAMAAGDWPDTDRPTANAGWGDPDTPNRTGKLEC